ncbi:zinc finger SWIM domain-containing protein 3 isoform X2 [Corvus kubaryi]|uniref:zinc finger SWIM domain-containing protein 3 isoform X2 n=1 Tax=Corvus kubaryi TaxID=68294 RepID=UPI001C03E939|nr:zinc finger SWIM domain-containing protein 3 isoform X2 [Corvus kubaryi]
MELGARFLSYKGCLYGLWSCVPVRSHNRQHGTAVRQDVRFIQVKFGGAQIQKYSEKRKNNHPSLCPAYFVLQYKEGIDQLVISEVNNHHAHTCTGCSTRQHRDKAALEAADQGHRKWCHGEQGLTHGHGTPVDGVPCSKHGSHTP